MTRKSPSDKATFASHAEELQRRGLRVLFAFGLACFFAFPLARPVLEILLRPLGEAVYFSPGEALFVHLKIVLTLAFLFVFPYFLWEAWRFVSSALFPNEKRFLILYFPLLLAAFLSGIFFGFFCVLPLTLRFFRQFAMESLIPVISIGPYLSFVTSLVLSFGFIFELPVAVLWLSHIGFLTPEYLKQKWRHAVVAVFIVSAVLTPPDIVSQLLMVIPIGFLYGISLALSYVGVGLRKGRIASVGSAV